MVALGSSVITILIVVIVASEIGKRNAAALTSASTETHARPTGNREEQAGVACLRAVAGQPPRLRRGRRWPDQLAVAAGFEPAEGCPSRAFEARSLGRSDTPPRERLPRRCHDTSRFHDRAVALVNAYLRTRPQMSAESAISGVIRGLVRRNGAGVVK